MGFGGRGCVLIARLHWVHRDFMIKWGISPMAWLSGRSYWQLRPTFMELNLISMSTPKFVSVITASLKYEVHSANLNLTLSST